jgi:hypothetical protein
MTCSVFGYTEFDGETYVLAAKFSNRRTSIGYIMTEMVEDFLCYTRRPLARWLINVGKTCDVEADPAEIWGLSYVDVGDAMSGSYAIWGKHPMIDGVDVDPPIQIGVPFKCKEFMQKYKKKTVSCSAGGKGYIFTRRHIVTQLNFRCHYTLWGYALQEAMRNGGNLSCAQFTGSVELLGQKRRTSCAFGMVLGEKGWMVGQFGAVMVPGGSYVLNDKVYTELHVHCVSGIRQGVEAVWRPIHEAGEAMAVGGGVAHGEILPGVMRMRGDLCVRHHWFHCYFDDGCDYHDVDGSVDTRYEEAAREVVGCRHQYYDADILKKMRAHYNRIPSSYRWLDERRCVAAPPCDCSDEEVEEPAVGGVGTVEAGVTDGGGSEAVVEAARREFGPVGVSIKRKRCVEESEEPAGEGVEAVDAGATGGNGSDGVVEAGQRRLGPVGVAIYRKLAVPVCDGPPVIERLVGTGLGSKDVDLYSFAAEAYGWEKLKKMPVEESAGLLAALFRNLEIARHGENYVDGFYAPMVDEVEVFSCGQLDEDEEDGEIMRVVCQRDYLGVQLTHLVLRLANDEDGSKTQLLGTVALAVLGSGLETWPPGKILDTVNQLQRELLPIL